MSIFSKLFGRRLTKIDLIRMLTKKRIGSDPMAGFAGVTPDMVDSQPDAYMLGTPEGTIITIVESYTAIKRLALSKRQEISDEKILSLIEQHRSMIGAHTMPSPLTLRSYIRYRVSLEYSAYPPVSDDSMDYSMQESKRFFESA